MLQVVKSESFRLIRLTMLSLRHTLDNSPIVGAVIALAFQPFLEHLLQDRFVVVDQ